MKFCIVHYNTPELTTCLCSSINKFHDDAEIIILDNSDKRPFNNEDIFDNVKVLDNTKEQLFKYDLLNKVSNKDAFTAANKTNGCGSAKHIISIQYLIDLLKEDFILLDSDVLLKRNVYEIITDGICSGDIIPNKRFLPFIMYLNYNKIKINGINFFDKNRTLGLSDKINDTGASFYQDIQKKKIIFNRINYNKYVIHYGNGSWTSNRKTCNRTFPIYKNTWKEFLMRNKELYI